MGKSAEGEGKRARSAADRSPLRIPDVRRLVVSHIVTVVAEWAGFVVIVVYAYQRGGPSQTGMMSTATFVPAVIGGPIAALVLARWSPRKGRVFGLAVQSVGWSIAGILAVWRLEPIVVTLPAFVALVALGTLRPSGAVLLPSVVRSGRELTATSFWIAHGESACAMVGPLSAGLLLTAGGPPAVFFGCAVATTFALVQSMAMQGDGPLSPRPTRTKRGTFDATRGAILALLGVRSVVLGALNVLVVVLAYEVFTLGEGGTGFLNALAGAGAILSIVVLAVTARLPRLAPILGLSAVTVAASCALLGGSHSRVVAVVALPLIGLGCALTNNVSRILLQRATEPSGLGALFARAELVSGAGWLVGSGFAQLALALTDLRAAFFGLAALVAAVLVVGGSAAWHADTATDVPVVELSVLRGLPQFQPLSPVEMDLIARAATTIPVRDGDVITRQGDHGDRFYAVVSGTFTVHTSRGLVRRIGRGEYFGEVALLADVPRTATVRAEGDGVLLAVDRVPFLIAVTGSDTSLAAMHGVMRSMQFDSEMPFETDVRA